MSQMNEMEEITCTLCGSQQWTLYGRIPDLLLNRRNVVSQLVQCKACGLVYQNPRPTLEAIGIHYPSEDYEPYTDQMATHQPWLLRQVMAYGMGKRRRFVTRYCQGGRLLDLGCSVGTFLTGMQHLDNWELFGVEINPDVAQIARQRYTLNVFTGTLEEAAYPDDHFDVVTMWDVLEHLHDPVGTLQEINRILKPGGIVVIRVPNLASLDARLFGNAWAGLDAPRHLYVFTPKTLAVALEKAGFSVVENSGGIGSYPTFMLSVRFQLRAMGVASQLEERIARLLNHPITRLITAPFFFFPGLLLRGPLLVTTAKQYQSSRSKDVQ
jgi:2-polyprenyl-3-methyl-5-hydroxy-6-metoxy-1,4-benzoquinol methylase